MEGDTGVTLVLTYKNLTKMLRAKFFKEIGFKPYQYAQQMQAFSII